MKDKRSKKRKGKEKGPLLPSILISACTATTGLSFAAVLSTSGQPNTKNLSGLS